MNCSIDQLFAALETSRIELPSWIQFFAHPPELLPDRAMRPLEEVSHL